MAEAAPDGGRSNVKRLRIGGVDVAFPFSPYPSQVAVMGRVIAACERKECALLESPTGSGKTLALLCSSACSSPASPRDCIVGCSVAVRLFVLFQVLILSLLQLAAALSWQHHWHLKKSKSLDGTAGVAPAEGEAAEDGGDQADIVRRRDGDVPKRPGGAGCGGCSGGGCGDEEADKAAELPAGPTEARAPTCASMRLSQSLGKERKHETSNLVPSSESAPGARASHLLRDAHAFADQTGRQGAESLWVQTAHDGEISEPECTLLSLRVVAKPCANTCMLRALHLSLGGDSLASWIRLCRPGNSTASQLLCLDPSARAHSANSQLLRRSSARESSTASTSPCAQSCVAVAAAAAAGVGAAGPRLAARA